MELTKGKIYKALQHTPMGDLTENKLYIFLGERSDYMVYDRFPEYLIRRSYHFFDIEKETYVEWIIDGKQDYQALTLPKYLQETGKGWTRPKAGEVIPIKREAFDISNGKDLLRDQMPYFKSIAEGENDIENIFVWIERHDALLSHHLTGKERLELKMFPFKSVCYWLDFYGVNYQRSNKYSWLDKLTDAW